MVIQLIKDVSRGILKTRSPKWPSLRRSFLMGRKCASCGGGKKLVAHHILPFHLYPHLELEKTNLIALCESKQNGLNCHLFVGHCGSFRAINPSVVTDAPEYLVKIKSRRVQTN